MMEIAPELRKVQEKYKGKKDQLSREAMSRETMALYKKHGTTPVSSCLPLLVQMPIFFALFSVLNDVQQARRGRHRRRRSAQRRAHDGVLQREALRRRVAARDARSTRSTPATPRRSSILLTLVVLMIALAVLHAAADHLEEPLPRGQDRPGVPDAEDHALRPALRASSSRASSSRSASSSTGSCRTCGRWVSSSSSSARCRPPARMPRRRAKSDWRARARRSTRRARSCRWRSTRPSSSVCSKRPSAPRPPPRSASSRSSKQRAKKQAPEAAAEAGRSSRRRRGRGILTPPLRPSASRSILRIT